MNSKEWFHYVLKTRLNEPLNHDEEEIFFGCGCFWGAEKGFWKLPGVKTTAVGYAGGDFDNPSYKDVCSGRTGHSEVVKVVWNKKVIDLSDLLKLFWECHDPTQYHRQGNDRGTQYRSAIFPTNKNQIELVIASKERYQELLSLKGYGAIQTEISNNQLFYYAEEYHQQYLAKPGSRPYCSAMPTQILLDNFKGSNYKLDKLIWSNFDWSINHCILRSTIEPISLTSMNKNK
ncbi:MULTISPECIES: peptide-methionine (S)-S-oxide reductase MsrA [Prochlorococcus]|uniref:peptide-methionine (S)-S-oxide reductase MsrA n=2 Tax=Prochlorococcus TaxID=1218 RepID=UPI001F4CE870|nr:MULTISPECIES: peptide-methionine (S)-S-oxide reductase MsrA [Prochlorococcus]